MAGEDKDPWKFEVKPAAYARCKGREVPDGAPKQARVVVARHQRRREALKPEYDASPITGRYSDESFTFHVNHAGTHVECWASASLGGEYERKILRYGGDLKGGGVFELYEHPSFQAAQSASPPPRPLDPVISPCPTVAARLKRSPADPEGLIFELANGYQFKLHRESKDATLSEKALAIFPDVGGIVRAYQWFPLTEQDRAMLARALRPEILNYFIARCEDQRGSQSYEKAKLWNLVKELDDYLGMVFATEKGRYKPSLPPSITLPVMASDDWRGWNKADLPLLHFYARYILNTQRFDHGGFDLTHIQWLERITAAVGPNVTDVYSMPHAREHFGLKKPLRSKGEGKYEYVLRVVVLELSTDKILKKIPKWVPRPGVGAAWGKAFIECKGLWPKPVVYNIAFATVSAGWGVGDSAGDFDPKSEGQTDDPWLPPDFIGPIEVYDASASVTLAKGGVGAMKIVGNKRYAPLWIDTGGPGVNFGPSVEIRGKIGPGYIWEEEQDTTSIHFKSPDVPIKDDDYIGAGAAKNQLYFELDSALLKPVGWQVLRYVCALELAALSSTTAHLLVLGHADRLDTEERNVELSQLRADNVLQAIRDILGPSLKIPERQIAAQGLGERGAETVAKDKDQTPNPDWRRVDVIINSRLVVTLHGE